MNPIELDELEPEPEPGLTLDLEVELERDLEATLELEGLEECADLYELCTRIGLDGRSLVLADLFIETAMGESVSRDDRAELWRLERALAEISLKSPELGDQLYEEWSALQDDARKHYQREKLRQARARGRLRRTAGPDEIASWCRSHGLRIYVKASKTRCEGRAPRRATNHRTAGSRRGASGRSATRTASRGDPDEGESSSSHSPLLLGGGR